MMKILLVLFVILSVLEPIVEGACAPNTNCPIPFDEKMKKQILNYHNKVRSKPDPPAKDMQLLYWDDTMAKMAMEYSAKCVWAHNSAAERSFDGYLNVGQNLWGTSGGRPSNYYSPARAWYNEIKWFTYGKKTKKVVGHYTQVMQAKSARIGCGMAYCPNFRLKYIITCHYLKGQYNFLKPYKRGKPCAMCPKSCVNNMCDCKGKVCHNGGKINLKTCKCKCRGRTRGKTCKQVKCKAVDKGICKTFKSKCATKYGYTVRNTCVHTCGLCKPTAN